MATPRKQQICLSQTSYYHCVSRCVRRAFLCGKDDNANQSFEHRRDWVESRLLKLAAVYCIGICAFAVMSNHTHVVVKIDDEKAKALSDEQILTRWHTLHYGTLLTRKFMKGEPIDDAEQLTLQATVAIYRKRLVSLSWFMKDLNEYIARLANDEDNCTGRFWEGRFKSQALLDEAAILTCMAYVDLNPVRAKMAKTLSTSAHTSVQRRIKAAMNHTEPKSLLPFTGGESLKAQPGIPFNLKDYLQLVESTGRCIRVGNKGVLDEKSTSSLASLGLSDENWLSITQHFEDYFKGAVGKPESLEQHMLKSKLRRQYNKSASQRYFT